MEKVILLPENFEWICGIITIQVIRNIHCTIGNNACNLSARLKEVVIKKKTKSFEAIVQLENADEKTFKVIDSSNFILTNFLMLENYVQVEACM